MVAHRSIRAGTATAPQLRVLAPSGDGDRTPAAFLNDPTPDAVRRALEGNQRQWLLRLARYGGDLIVRERGIVWHERPGGGDGGEIQIPFPRFDHRRLGEQLDAFMARLGRQTPRPVRLWLPDPPRPSDLPIRLLARGFRPGFRPRWMRLDLWRLREARWGPPGLRIERTAEAEIWDRFPHPYHGAGATARTTATAIERAAWALPEQVIPFVSWLDGRPVATATLHLTGGPLGIAGIYDVGVLPAYRNRGIAKAITTEAGKTAWAIGCAVAGLNATPLGEPVYRRLGFEVAGEGQTWEAPADAWGNGVARPEVVAFAEALGRGDIPRLDSHMNDLPTDAVAVRLGCGLTPVQLATRFGQAAAVEWLTERGAELDLFSAWDLGWTERAIRLLAERPALANARDEAGATPLHEAVRRNDLDLGSLLLAAGADPALTDGSFDSTPLGWAEHFGYDEMATLIREATVGREPR